MNEDQYVLIVDDDPNARSILGTIMSTLGVNIEEAANGEEAVAHIEKRLPAFIYLDLMMPQMNGFEFLIYLRSNPRSRNIPVIVVSAYIGELDLPQLKGVNIIEKSHFRAREVRNNASALLGTAKSSVENEQPAMTNLETRKTFRQASTTTPMERDQVLRGAILDSLTSRELEVLKLLTKGLTNQEIASELIVSLNTIKSHVSSILKKLNVRNRTQAVNHGRALNLID